MKTADKRSDTSIFQLMSSRIITFLGSNLFFWLIVTLFILQALWLVFSFKYAMLYDESYHYGAINFFAQTWNPAPSEQPASFDTSGLLIYSNASLYHYIMAIPFRVISFITTDFTAQIIALRLLNVLLAVSTLFIFRSLLLRLDIKKSIINASLLVYTLLPITSLLSATISYDNVVIPLTGLFLLLGVRVLTAEKKNLLLNGYLFVLVGILASLIKFTFLPVFVAGVAFILFKTLIPYKEKYLLSFRQLFRRKGLVYILLLVIPMILLGYVGLARYGVGVVRYGSVLPDCKIVIGKERCDKLNYYRETEELRITKDERKQMSVDNYLFDWANKMTTRFDTTGIQLPDGPGKYDDQFARKLPALSLLITIGVITIFFCSVFMLHRFIGDRRWQLIIASGVLLTVTLFIFNVLSYYSANENLNVQVRYLLGFVPIIIAFGLMSIDEMIRRREIKVISFIILLLLASQGAGVMKHIASAKDSWYWQNATVENINQSTKRAVRAWLHQADKY